MDQNTWVTFFRFLFNYLTRCKFSTQERSLVAHMPNDSHTRYQWPHSARDIPSDHLVYLVSRNRLGFCTGALLTSSVSQFSPRERCYTMSVHLSADFYLAFYLGDTRVCQQVRMLRIMPYSLVEFFNSNLAAPSRDTCESCLFHLVLPPPSEY